MLNVLSSIANTIVSLLKFVIHSFQSILNLLGHIPQFVAVLTTGVGTLPVLILPFALASISLSVVLFVLNRNN